MATTATTMRDLAIPSPAAAFTLQSVHRIDENQNSSEISKDSLESQNMRDSISSNGKSPSYGSSEDLRGNSSSSPSTGTDYLPEDSPRGEKHCPAVMTGKSPESEDSAVTFLRSARRLPRRDDCLVSTPDAESTPRRKHRSVNNNESTEEEPQCPACCRDFSNWSLLMSHLKTAHPDQEMACEPCHLTFDSASDLDSHRSRVHISDTKSTELRNKLQLPSQRFRIDRKNTKNMPKVIGFQDLNFMDFTSNKFPHVAKDICEKRLHLSKDKFCFQCRLCGRGFPCSSSLEIHAKTCGQESEEKKVVKKNKRKSTPQFRPQAVRMESDESDDNLENDIVEKQRNDFFSSLNLRNNESSSKSSPKSSEDELDRQKINVIREARDTKDLADIESMISVTNIPGINMKNLQLPLAKPKLENKPSNLLNIHIDSNHSSPRNFSHATSPNFNMANIISPNPHTPDFNEEEAQDCFAAECRRMKLRGEFPCKLCIQVFPNLRALKGHNRVHVSVASGTPSSPYRCNICPYSSLDKATLVRHMRSHNGDRPYECAMCNYAFTTKANCERHLRNRHSKMTRDEVKSSIIYHPSEDPINDSEYLKTTEMNKRNLDKAKEFKQEFSLPMNLKINLAVLKDRQRSEDLFHAEHQQMLKNICNGSKHSQSRMEAGTMTEVKLESPPMEEPWSGEEALDLRVNKYKYDTPPSECSDEPEDLTRKDLKEFNNNIEIGTKDVEMSAFPSPPFEPKTPDISSLVKMYSTMYPSLSITQLQQIILTQINFPTLFQRLPYPQFLMPPTVFPNATYPKTTPNDTAGLQMSGGSLMDDRKLSPTQANKLPFFQKEALAKIMINREKDRIASDFYKSPDVAEKARFNDYFTETDKKAFHDILVKREVEENPAFPTNKPPDSTTTTDNKSPSVKMVIKNGVLMPKQKQRRYRTERPFSCEHCSARFTLRSNMERHIKQQHPRFWTQKSRYNVGQGRKSDTKLGLDDFYKNYEASRSDVGSSAGDWDPEKSFDRHMKTEDNCEDSDEEEQKEMSDEEASKDELIIDEENGEDRLRLLANVTEYLKCKQEAREATVGEGREPQTQDLASVSKMLDNAVTQTQAFQKYFQDGRKEEDECRRDEGERSEEEEGLIAGSTSSDENKSESEVTTKATKKKSAYSMAPNRVSCPYCFRKFPWTSSLRRHVLTHTGQKPFKCTHCPLLFTTKSNCDRHLLRKHGREALIASSGQTENHEGGAANNTSPVTSPSAPSQQTVPNANANLRNVPERPYKCTHCPASTFSNLSNLTKHIASKHQDNHIVSPNGPQSPDHSRVKNINPLAPPNVTITTTFPINIPKALSIIPQYPGPIKPLRFPITVPNVKNEWGLTNGDHKDEFSNFRKRSSSEDTEASDRKRSSPDVFKAGQAIDSFSDSETVRGDQLPVIPASDLPFKCHLCEGSYGERSEALDHIRMHHTAEFQLLMSKGALETNSEEDRTPHDDHDDIEHSRGRFPDYAHRKVMCAFCMRRFWSAEDLRRHMRTHTGERPFSCDVCHRKFTLKHSMLRHRKKHNTNEELLIGSDEEHQTVGSTTTLEENSYQPKTILHQTLTRKDEARQDGINA